MSPFQKKFYAKLYRLRIVEQKRFAVGGAKYTEDLKRFHQLQDEYLLIVNNDIKSVVNLVDFINEQEEKIQQIEDRQHEIYRESSSRKRSIKNEEQYREYQIWYVEVQEELDELKQEKRNIKRQIQLADDIVKEDLYTAYYAVSEDEEIVADREIEIPGMEEQANLYDVEHQIMDNATSEQIYTGENGIVDDVEADIPIAANNVESIADSLSEYGVYEDIDIAVKADIFGFDIANVSGNIRLFSDVIKRLGIKLDGDEIYEEFQRIYNKSVSMDADKGKMEDRMWDIGRGK